MSQNQQAKGWSFCHSKFDLPVLAQGHKGPVEDWNMMQREAMHLIKDFTTEHAHVKIEFYMGMVMEEQQTFKGLMQHLKNAFQSGETISELISYFYSWAQKKNESKDTFADKLQILVPK